MDKKAKRIRKKSTEFVGLLILLKPEERDALNSLVDIRTRDARVLAIDDHELRDKRISQSSIVREHLLADQQFRAELRRIVTARAKRKKAREESKQSQQAEAQNE